ncbi:MAG: hypothetical protein AAGK10_00270 [Cyanobacteria bacterium J06555_3]
MRSNQRRFKISKLAAFLGIFFLTAAIAIGGFWLAQRPVAKVERLGNPLREDGQTDRALNVWDLQTYDGKIYLAGGSTVTNPGPINVWAYDPQQADFVKEYQVQEEAIEHYRLFAERLYIPAADPTKGDLHKFYRREEGKWQQYSSGEVKLAHVRDLIETDTGEILMVGNSRQIRKLSSRGTVIAIPQADGIKIAPAGVENITTSGVVIADFNWFFSVFRYRNQIYATNSLLRDAENYPGAIAKYDPQLKQFVLDFNLRNAEFIPTEIIAGQNKQGLNVIYRPWNPVEYQGYLVYPVRSYSITPDNYQQAYMNSIGFFYKSDMGSSPQTLKLPQGKGEDVLIINNMLYVLASRQNRDDKFTNYVYRTDRLSPKTKWQRVVKFKSWNKARSFEYLDGTFYFGLGQDYGHAVNNAGDILSYRSTKKNDPK